MRKLLQHFRNNQGDSNVSKMTIVAIVFVVGAILLVLTTSAFRNPVHNWFSKVTAGWFEEENGMYEADNKFLYAERNTNGTIKDAEYVCYLNDEKTRFFKLPYVNDLVDGQNGDGVCLDWNLTGAYVVSWVGDDYTLDISDDGLSINMVDIRTGQVEETFYAELP